MIVFTTALITVGIMLLYCVPGFALVKFKAVKEEHILPFSKLLLYGLQPFLILYLLTGKDNSKQTLINAGWFALATFVMLGSFIAILWLIFRKRMKEDTRYRIYTVASCLTNSSFMGVPLLEELLPGTDAALYSAVFTIVMNLLGWTVVSAILSQDLSYIKPKKLLLNPLTLSLCIAVPIFLAGFTFPRQLSDMISLLGRMTTPVSMMIIGMRLATVSAKDFFCDYKNYLVIGVKMIIFPLVWVLISRLFPLDPWLSDTMLVMCCCPAASIVLNFSEFVGKGQKTAVNIVLMSTLLCILTLPVMLMIFM